MAPSAASAQVYQLDVDAGGMLDGQFLQYGDVLKLEKMPTKQELIRDLAIMINKVCSTLSIPTFCMHPYAP